jgi:hypothetical protein
MNIQTMKSFKVSKYPRVTSMMLPGDVQRLVKEVMERERLDAKDTIAHIIRKYAKQEGIEVVKDISCIEQQKGGSGFYAG